jgi:hypothetical protein
MITFKSVLASFKEAASMPNRYQREIEEILRNLEATDAKGGSGQKFGERFRRRPTYRPKPKKRGLPSLNFRASDWFIVVTVVAALIAGGYAYLIQGGNFITGIIALVGIVSLFFVVASPFLFQQRRTRQYAGYEKITPLYRNPFQGFVTRWNLFLLKMRYRRRNDR